MNANVMFSHKSNEWATPQDFFDELNNEFHFTLDPCSTHGNAKCANHYTAEEDGLSKKWGGQTVFCNPPYGRELPKWVKKCYEESQRATVVMLIPARTDTRWFHDYIYGKAEIRFIKGRLKFGDGKSPAPFPSMVVIYKREVW
jgi:site-specific DNA-methyltransferase (adenine-specific)